MRQSDQKQREATQLLRDKYGGQKSADFFTDCARLASGEPLAYVIGWVPFFGCKIWLDSRPLIPRTETEWWTEKAIESIRARKCRPIDILDLCAGSGCIGTAVGAAIGEEARVTFVELDAAHISTIEKNCHENGVANRTVLAADLFAGVGGAFAYILANPPYLDRKLNRVEESVVAYEPLRALDGGQAGMEIIERIIAGAPARLSPDGELWLEHEPEQTNAIIRLAKMHGFYPTSHLDQYGVQRFSRLVLQ
jgi:release factor glutamine methyltransferase